MKHIAGGNFTLLAGCGQEGVTDGKCTTASFYQVTDMCCEFDTNLYIVDIQAGSLHLVTSMQGTEEFLQKLGKLYSSFGLTIKDGPPVEPTTLAGAIENLQELKLYLELMRDNAMEIQNIGGTMNGPQGTVSSKTRSSVTMLCSEMEYLQEVLEEINPQIIPSLDLNTLLTISVENLHAVAHFKDQMMTMLQYSRNLTNTVYESLKCTVKWSAYYYTHRSSYYPVPNNAMTDEAD